MRAFLPAGLQDWKEVPRVRALNDRAPNAKGRYVLCWLQQALRARDNPVIDASVLLGNALGLPVLARIAAYANAGVDPAIMGIGPVSATRRCLDKAGWSLEALDLIEANEAFAAQSLSVGKELGWDMDKVNVNGGAIAIGHPIGASGCRVLVTLLHEMIKRDAKKGLATLCIGGGQGVALALARS